MARDGRLRRALRIRRPLRQTTDLRRAAGLRRRGGGLLVERQTVVPLAVDPHVAVRDTGEDALEAARLGGFAAAGTARVVAAGLSALLVRCRFTSAVDGLSVCGRRKHCHSADCNGSRTDDGGGESTPGGRGGGRGGGRAHGVLLGWLQPVCCVQRLGETD